MASMKQGKGLKDENTLIERYSEKLSFYLSEFQKDLRLRNIRGNVGKEQGVRLTMRE